jgi:hypothetical protein
LCELPTNRDVVVHPEVRLAITLYIENNQLELTRWDMTTGTEVGRHVVALGARELVRSKSYEWPKNGILTFETSSSPFIVQILLRSWLSALPMFSKVYLARTVTYTFFDIRTPCVIGGCTVYDTDRPIARISPDAQTVAVILPGESRLALWDIPPRKSLAHFAAGAAILALPIAFVARRRERELRAT